MPRRKKFPFALYAVKDGIATITLNDPDHLNRISQQPGGLLENLIDAAKLAESDDEVRCVVVTGAGRAFSSGGAGDGAIGDPNYTALDAWEFLQLTRSLDKTFLELEKPVIGAINGLCYGAAFQLVLSFDFLVAQDTARFGLIETRFGATGVATLPFLVGPQWARFLAISGELITAQKAKEIGLVIDVFPEETFTNKVQDLARRVASMPADAVRLNRRLILAAQKIIGWADTMELSYALDAITNVLSKEATAADGQRFADLRNDWKAFKEACDKPFEPPWLAD